MAVKLIGIAAVFLVCTAAGLGKSHSLTKRVRELEGFLGAISFIETEIRYFAEPTGEIMSKLSESKEFSPLKVFGLCASHLAATRDLSAAWRLALEQSRQSLSLDDGDAEALTSFGEAFGTTDAEGQLANCERCRELLQRRLESAREDRQRRGRMFTSLGVLAGVFFAVILY